MTKQADGRFTIDNGTSVVPDVTLRANRDGSYSLSDIPYIIEPQKAVPQIVRGDVNADGSFGVTDIVMMQKYLLHEGSLIDPQAGDLDNDGALDIFDLALMKRELMQLR